MKGYLLYVCLIAITFSIGAIPPILAQEVITVNQTEPCFLNYTAGVQMWRNCGYSEDYISAALAPWEWITGGNFSLVIVSIFVLFSYIKYHKIVYPIMIGVMFLPISYFVFPAEFLSFAIILTFLGLGILVWYTFIKQTKEY